MSETVNHSVFGELEKEIDDEGRVHLEGEVSIAGGPSCRVHITGSGETPVEEILQIAATAHEQFTAREAELRREAVNQTITDERLREIAEDLGEEISRDEAVEAYSSIMIINYFTESNEVSIYFEDEEGLFGVDVNLVSDLAFSQIKADMDG